MEQINPQDIKLTFGEYSELVSKFRLPSADQMYVIMGLVGELGELYGMIAKASRDGTQLEQRLVKKEIGDILWFLDQLAKDAGSSLEECAAINYAKLADREFRGVITGSGDER